LLCKKVLLPESRSFVTALVVFRSFLLAAGQLMAATFN